MRVCYWEDPKAKLAAVREWQKRNPEKVKRYKRANNKKAWADPVRRNKLSERHRQYCKRLRQTQEGAQQIRDRAKRFLDSKRNDEKWKYSERNRRTEWYKRTIAKRRIYARINSHKRRVLIQTGGNHTEEEIALLRKQQGNKCNACHRSLTKRFEIDHIMPVSRGGTNSIENLELLCRRCNRSKGDMLPEEWAAKLGLLYI